MSHRRPDRWTRLPLALALCAAVLGAGCAGEESARLVDFLDELEFDVPLETAAYVSLGRFDIPISAQGGAGKASAFVQEIADQGLVWMRLQFELTAETTPAQEKELLEVAERHRGALSDAVLTAVRTSTVDELADPHLSAINAKLTDVVRPILGEELVRQFVLNDPATVAAQEKAKQKAGHGDGHGEDAGHGEESHGEEGHDAEGHGEEGHGDEAHGEHGDEGHGEDAHGDH
ncbi:MAG: hypothetical protein H0T51_16555 [Pirellulales bacterium]|nr:hypothetical protein [Pirellulales bacterium]